ncbi:MAG: hypothetical protein F6K34_10490, partial [Okeania sp. SIO4D6]|nr:hypothetical protein [Okeania sp. SIO4D6]
MSYNLKFIRELVDQGLTLQEFNDLVFDDFPNVQRQFTDGQTKSQQIRILVDYAQRHKEIDKLLECIKSINPTVVFDESSGQVQTEGSQLQVIENKVDILLSGQVSIYQDINEMRQALLERYDAGEKAIIATIAGQLDETQLVLTQTLLEV